MLPGISYLELSTDYTDYTDFLRIIIRVNLRNLRISGVRE